MIAGIEKTDDDFGDGQLERRQKRSDFQEPDRIEAGEGWLCEVLSERTLAVAMTTSKQIPPPMARVEPPPRREVRRWRNPLR